MDIDDADISNWILEFLLKQPLEDRTIDALLRILPLPSNNNNNNPHHLPKSILLKCLDSQLSSISEKALGLLEQLEEIEFSRGVSDSMKHAYCAVAVECTVKHLAKNDGGKSTSSTFEFFDAVDRVWRKRIGRMEVLLGKGGGLCSEELWTWRDEIEAAVSHDNVCKTLLNKSASLNAVEAVSIYLKEERDKIGPSFLEVAAERLSDDDVQMLGVGVVDPLHGKAPSHPSTPVAIGALNEPTTTLHHLQADVLDVHEMPTGPSHRNCNLLNSSEVNKVLEALELSSRELQAVVKDPLPDALRVAEAMSDIARDARTSLMERNNTAHTYEWEESIDSSLEDPGRGTLKLSSPKDIHVSPLDKYEIKNLKGRRRKRKWSVIEEDTLRTGVETYGRGNWKVILNAYRDVFEDRTEVDLKDKWRNLTRY